MSDIETSLKTVVGFLTVVFHHLSEGVEEVGFGFLYRFTFGEDLGEFLEVAGEAAFGAGSKTAVSLSFRFSNVMQAFSRGLGRHSRRLRLPLPMNRVLHQFGRILQIQLLLDVRPVGLDRFHAQVQFLGDLPGGEALANEGEYLKLAVAQVFEG